MSAGFRECLILETGFPIICKKISSRKLTYAPYGPCGKTTIVPTSLVAHARKEAVNGEAVSRVTLRGPRVSLVVSIPVRHSLAGDRLYELVLAHVKCDATVVVRSLVRAKRYRPHLTRRSGVEGRGVHQIIGIRPGTTTRLILTIRYEC